MTTPYYQDDLVTLHHGDCREMTDWLSADVLVTDPPYGRAWKQGELDKRPNGHGGIANDLSTTVRDDALSLWGDRPALAFGDLMLAPPLGTRQVLIYKKQPNAGTRGAMGGWRRDAEAIYLIGPWTSGLGGESSIIATGSRSAGNPSSVQSRYGHPHAKPVDVMETLLGHTSGVVADPFAGSGSTLVAARNLGRRAIGVELRESYCEAIARRLDQGVLDLGQDVSVTPQPEFRIATAEEFARALRVAEAILQGGAA